MNTKEVITIIDGYKCHYAGITHDGYTQAYISKGKYSASMEFALQCGYLSLSEDFGEDCDEETQKIRETTLKKIEDWGKQVGYFV
jgi:hypothetical protein